MLWLRHCFQLLSVELWEQFASFAFVDVWRWLVGLVGERSPACPATCQPFMATWTRAFKKRALMQPWPLPRADTMSFPVCSLSIQRKAFRRDALTVNQCSLTGGCLSLRVDQHWHRPTLPFVLMRIVQDSST